MNISVIIPAYNADRTIAAALHSLQSQSYPHWEAIIVDDGSQDSTVEIVQTLAAEDGRIHLATQEHGGASQARNHAIRLAQYDWLLFLDADDFITDDHLAILTTHLQADPTLDAVYGRGKYVMPDGVMLPASGQPQASMFEAFARACVLCINACIIRRSVVAQAGYFDPTQSNCNDWDLWQRAARTGARFGFVDEVVAYYRILPNSISKDGARLLRQGLRVISRGYSSDERVTNPAAAYRNGRQQPDQAQTALTFFCWAAGLEIGQGRDATPLLPHIAPYIAPDLDPLRAVHTLFEAVWLAAGQTPDAWLALWPQIAAPVTQVWTALEKQAKAPHFVSRAQRELARLILTSASADTYPAQLGSFQAITLDVTQPIHCVHLPPQIDRLLVAVTLADSTLGTVEFPVHDGVVPAIVLADRIAARFAWEILGHFFEQSLYLTLAWQDEGRTIWRDEVRLAEEPGVPLHDTIGWTIFLQELWQRPAWSADDFYNQELSDRPFKLLTVTETAVTLDLGQPLPDIATDHDELALTVQVGDVSIGTITVPTPLPIQCAQSLRVAITSQFGFELCRAVVRQALIGQPLNTPGTLLHRLKNAASQHQCQPYQNALMVDRYEGAIATAVSRYATLPSSVAALVKANHPTWQANDTAVIDGILYRPDGHAPAYSFPPAPPAEETTTHLPILRYLRIAEPATAAQATVCVSPPAFAAQLNYLHDNGYRTIPLTQWQQATAEKRPLPGKAICLTFDGGYTDFSTHAFPLLRQYNFAATLFVASDWIGQTNCHDQIYGMGGDLLGYKSLREILDGGITIGSLTANHRPLTALTPTAIATEALRSRHKLMSIAERPITAFAYPYGAWDAGVQQIFEAAGYIYGFTGNNGRATYQTSLTALPRITVTGSPSLITFATSITQGHTIRP